MAEEEKVQDELTASEQRILKMNDVAAKYIEKPENLMYSPNAMAINDAVIRSMIGSMDDEMFEGFITLFEDIVSKLKFRDRLTDEMAMAGKGVIIT